MKPFIKKERIFMIVFFSLILLSLFFNIINLKQFIIYPISLSANLFLIFIIKLIIEKFKITYSKTELLFLIIEIIGIELFYIYSIKTRLFIYYWDYSCYYNIQLDLIQAFENGLFSGLKQFIGSTWSGEYGSFLNFFPQIIFQFTNKSINSYLLSSVLTYIPYLVISFSIAIKRMMIIIKRKERIIFYLSLLLLVCMPMFHVSLIYGQPDVFGLCFIFLIISLVIDYNFKKIEYDRLCLLLITTFFLTICRRWYLYWILSFYGCYGITALINNKKERKIILINAIKFIGITAIIYVATLYPFIKNTLLSNYGTSYEFYSNGGFTTEVLHQINHIGILLMMILVGGMIYGLKEKKYRKYTISMSITNILIILLFTKIQNMGLHHSLLLLPTYFYCMIMLIICGLNNQKTISYTTIIMIFTILFLNTISSYIKLDNRLLGDVSLKVEKEQNYYEIKTVVDWLEKKLNEQDRAYMITHNNMFNPDKLRNFYTPNSTVHKYMPYGSAIIGTHKFPIELFQSRYVITTDPFDNTSIEYKYNEVFKELVLEETFQQIKTFSMKDNYQLIVYERIKEVTEEEKQKYIDSLKEESKKYKNLYENVIKEYN